MSPNLDELRLTPRSTKRKARTGECEPRNFLATTMEVSAQPSFDLRSNHRVPR
jgi:hypothetical protein